MPTTTPQSAGTHWTCPLCRGDLRLEQGQYRCAQGHSFDRAKEGYVNLLPANRKRSASPGDDKAMLRNRREFLELGHYRPLAERLGEICRAHAAETGDQSFALLDTGCGEGYYTGIIAQSLEDLEPQTTIWLGGIDIAKEAARMAAKRYPGLDFAVASNAGLPVADRSLDCALRIFAPAADAEIVRVLKPGGLFVAVTPGERHLFQLRGLVYDQPREHESKVQAIAGLEPIQRIALDYSIHLARAGEAAKLLAMTPYYWQASREKQAAIAARDDIETEVAFRIDCYRAPSRG